MSTLPEVTAEETAGFEAMRNEAPVAEAPPETKTEAPPETPVETKAEAPPETKPEALDEAEKAKRERLVPYGAVHEERTKRRSAEDALKAANEELARLRAGVQQPTPPVQQEQGVDPLGDIEALKQFKADFEKSQQENAERQAFSQRVIRMENEYAAANPEYKEAIDYLANFRRTQMRALGWGDEQINVALAKEAHDTARYAVANEQSPAEVFHALAKASGFTPKAPEPAPTAKAEPAAAATLERIAAGQKVAKSVSSAGGGAPEPTLSLAAMAALDGAEFDALWTKGGAARKAMA